MNIRQFAFGVLAAATVGGIGAASAADFNARSTPDPAIPNWTGFYIGLHAGVGWRSSEDWQFFDPNGVIRTNIVGPDTSKSPHLLFGFQGGYNWQLAPAWVIGVEADISWTSIGSDRVVTSTNFGGAVTPNTFISMSATTQWLSSVRGRLGYVGPWNAMFYGTGGVAWAQTTFNASERNLPPTFAQNFTAANADHSVQTGFVVGGGVEWMANPHFLYRIEYLYYGLDGTAISANLRPDPGAFPVAFRFTWPDYNIQTVRVGATYKF